MVCLLVCVNGIFQYQKKEKQKEGKMVEAEYTIEKTDGKDYDKPTGGAGDPTIPPGHSRFYCEKCRTVRCLQLAILKR